MNLQVHFKFVKEQVRENEFGSTEGGWEGGGRWWRRLWAGHGKRRSAPEAAGGAWGAAAPGSGRREGKAHAYRVGKREYSD